MAVGKTVGIAYVGSNPTPATLGKTPPHQGKRLVRGWRWCPAAFGWIRPNTVVPPQCHPKRLWSSGLENLAQGLALSAVTHFA